METKPWQTKLNGDPIPWLLEEDNPSVRYLTLVELLGKPPGSAEAMKAKKAIMTRGLVPKLLAKMDPAGHWEPPERFYTAKYKGTAWQLIVLAELFADGKEERIAAARDLLLERSQDRESGAFAHRSSARKGGGSHGEVIPCLTGNMIYAMVRLGYLDDPRVRQGIDWITEYQRFDDLIPDPPQGWPYDRYEMCWGRHTCHMGAVKALKALVEIPEKKRSAKAKRMIIEGAEYFLKHHIYKRSHDLTKVARPGWLRFGYPMMYQTDLVEILGILTRLGYRDDRMQEAMDIVIRSQDREGRWKMANTFNGRYQVDIEAKGKQSKWVTLNALRAIGRYYG